MAAAPRRRPAAAAHTILAARWSQAAQKAMSQLSPEQLEQATKAAQEQMKDMTPPDEGQRQHALFLHACPVGDATFTEGSR